jgi:UDP-N-acetylmuramoylalanine--D-glutamate ligase
LNALRETQRGPALDGAVVAVIGYGRSGRSAARLLLAAGSRVRVTDASALEKLGATEEEIPGGAEWIGREDPAVLAGCDLVIASPGVRPSSPVLAHALASGVPVRSEIELAWWFTDAPIVAITGTNGKTTTTELVGAMGRASGRRTVVAGNVGMPLSSVVLEERAELLVIEVSSFQLFLCREFRPHVGVLLNLAPDHLDWHPDFDHYANAKGNLFAHQVSGDAAVLNAKDPEVMRRFSGVPAEVFTFGESPAPKKGAFIRDERLTFHLGGEFEPVFALGEWRLQGRHNRENLLAASLAARLIGVEPQAISEGARTFRALPHRTEEVARANGVTFINDSKSTNPASLEKALDPELPTLLIAGGLTKGCDFGPLRETVASGARLVFLIGNGAEELEGAWKPGVKTVRAGDLETAVRLAIAEAKPGERVLLSPGCASFDQFDNYMHRGDCFKKYVREHLTGRGFEEGRG